MSSSIGPHTGFGTASNTSVKFGILQPDRTLLDWQGRRNITQLPILGSGRVVTQRGQRVPYEIALRLWFADREALEAMDALQGERATLWYSWKIGTKRLDGTLDHIAGVDYLRLDDVRLLRLEDDAIAIDGTAEATATFQKVVS